jgi:hypothetical protein
VFERVVATCIAADANKCRSTPGNEWSVDDVDPETAERAVRDYLATLDNPALGRGERGDAEIRHTRGSSRAVDGRAAQLLGILLRFGHIYFGRMIARTSATISAGVW